MVASGKARDEIARADRDNDVLLYLAEMELTELPESIGKLVHLTELWLSGNQLTQLPESIGQLVHLRRLYLSGNRLTQLPASIGHLTQLNILFLTSNALTELPETIGKLVLLGELYLCGNQLTQLPDSIGRLVHLRALHLADNRLTQLPESIGQLTQLEELVLQSNRLQRLPESIGHFTKLRQFFLDRNELTDLPASLQRLTSLEQFYIHDNVALNIPAEELGPRYHRAAPTPKPPREILDYYFRTRYLAKRPLNEAKLILIGRGGAGKTSLRKRLITGEWQEQEDKTPGIQVTPWSLTVGAHDVKLNVWDFGGQEIMHATHQFFLTRRSLYVLVLNAREGKQDSNVEYWLRLIGAYGAGSPTLVVVNKCDQHPLDLTEQTLREKFPFIREFVRTDCKTKEGLANLRGAIERETGELPDLRTPFPETWFSLKQNLEALPADCITYDAYRKLCDDNEEKDDGNQQVLIGFLHDLGTVLHFRHDPRLNDLGVLKPAWVTEGIYGLLNAKVVAKSGGLLTTSQLSTLLDAAKYPSHRHDFLLRLMEKFELCFELPHTGGAKFLIPELLPEEPEELPSWVTDVLGFEYHYNVLPEGLLPRFIVRTHTFSEIGPRWRSGVVLRQGAAEALIRADVQDRRVWIGVRGLGRQPRDLLAVVRGHFEEIHRGISGLTADEKVPVPGYPQVKLDYRKLLVREANLRTTVEFETETESIELPLGKLLDNFEAKASRAERVHHIKVEAGGHLHMPEQQQNINVGRDLTGIVGINQTFTQCYNTASAVQQPELAQALRGLIAEAEKAAPQLGAEQRGKLEKRLTMLTDAAKEPEPDKEVVQLSAKGIIEAAGIFPAVIAATKTVLGLFGIVIP